MSNKNFGQIIGIVILYILQYNSKNPETNLAFFLESPNKTLNYF